jgi:hypothetical protein
MIPRIRRSILDRSPRPASSPRGKTLDGKEAIVRRTRDSGGASLWIISLLIAGTIGTLIVVRAVQPDPEEIRAKFAAELSALEHHPQDDPIGRDHLAEELLATPGYPEFAPALYRHLERQHPRIHELAILEAEARAEVPLFRAHFGKIAECKPQELMGLRDTANALLLRYSASSFGPELTRIRDELSARLEALPSPGVAEREWVQVTVEVRRRANERDFDGALALLSEFEKKPAATALSDLPAKCAEQRDMVNRLAQNAARAAIKQAKEFVGAGSTREAVALIEKTLGTMGTLPAATMLRDYRAQIR